MGIGWHSFIERILYVVAGFALRQLPETCDLKRGVAKGPVALSGRTEVMTDPVQLCDVGTGKGYGVAAAPAVIGCSPASDIVADDAGESACLVMWSAWNRAFMAYQLDPDAHVAVTDGRSGACFNLRDGPAAVEVGDLLAVGNSRYLVKGYE